MKIQTISAFVLSASSAFALIGPGKMDHKTLCLSVYEGKDDALVAGACDQAANNVTSKLKLLSNGCAEGQVSLTASKRAEVKTYNISIPKCLPPHVIQL